MATLAFQCNVFVCISDEFMAPRTACVQASLVWRLSPSLDLFVLCPELGSDLRLDHNITHVSVLVVFFCYEREQLL